MNLTNFNNDELVSLYPALLNELKNREIIRTNNLIGDLGEYLAVNYYNNNFPLPKLLLNVNSAKNVDANSSHGERYAIKSISTNSTGVFHSVPIEETDIVYFEYLVIVMFDKNYNLNEIYELSWEDFKKYRKLKKPENKWNISINKALKENVKKIY